MMKLPSGQKNQLAQCLESIPHGTNRCVLAFSGGLDSCVLLHLLTNSPTLLKIKLWHVNHGLQAEAGIMADFCQLQADIYGLDLKISYLDLQETASNIEAIARTARYELFSKELLSDDCLLTAHHADDQVETFFLNVLRGSGSAGLRGIAARIPISNAILVRPMLYFKREALLEYAKEFNLDWFEDPSNSSDRFNRNYLRHNVMPLIEKRWPNYHESIATVSEIQVETQQLLEDLARIDYELVADKNVRGDLQGNLNILKLESLSLSRQKNVIRYWLRVNQRENLPRVRLDTFIKQLSAKLGRNPVIENKGYDIRIYNGRVFIVDHHLAQPKRSIYEFSTLPKLDIPELNLALKRQSVLDHLNVEDSGQNIQVVFRLNGKSDSKLDNNHAHRLKRLFQKYKIVPWQRNSTPQLYLDGELRGLWLEH